MSIWEHIKYFLRLIFTPNSLRTMEWKMLKLVNKDRKRNGLPKLRMQEDLREVARKHSKDMARKDYFEHENIKGQTPFDRLEQARVTDIVAGENLAKIRGYRNPVIRAEIGLMNSPGHRANILNKHYNTVGIGIIQSVDKSFYYTQNFALRDIIFTKKVPQKTTLKKGLRLKGTAFSKVKSIAYEVKYPKSSQKPIQQGVIPINKGKFDYILKFKEKGIFTVFIYVNKTGNQFSQSNKFLIKVRKNWFF